MLAAQCNNIFRIEWMIFRHGRLVAVVPSSPRDLDIEATTPATEYLGGRNEEGRRHKA
jgi:hypothetical protein